jgi:hypothetical protein
VTRQINALRQQGDLRISGDDGLMFGDSLIEDNPLPRLY